MPSLATRQQHEKMTSFWLVLVSLFAVGFAQYREDGRCGPEYLADNGQPAACDNIPPFPTWFVENLALVALVI